MYSHESYLKYRTSIRKSQKKYYDKNKAKICSKYAPIRRAWDADHRSYLNEHERLRKQIKELETRANYSFRTEKLLEIAYANKDYLRELHSRGLI